MNMFCRYYFLFAHIQSELPNTCEAPELMGSLNRCDIHSLCTLHFICHGMDGALHAHTHFPLLMECPVQAL